MLPYCRGMSQNSTALKNSGTCPLYEVCTLVSFDCGKEGASQRHYPQRGSCFHQKPLKYSKADGGNQTLYRLKELEFLKHIGPIADIMKVIQPIYNFKAGEEY